MADIPLPFEHQKTTTQFILDHPRTFVTSDPGTGKTRSVIDAFAQLRKAGGKRMLVLCPKSIMYPAWGSDIEKFAPQLSYSIAAAPDKTRMAAFQADTDIVIMNHDGVKWLTRNVRLLDGFDVLCVDESSAYKHRTSIRSKAARKIADWFPWRVLLTGTPNSNTVTDLWHQIYLLDDGERLGTSFWRFRSQVCEPAQNGPHPNHIQWVDKEGVELQVADLIRDINIRFKLDEVLDMPANVQSVVPFTLSPKHRKAYKELAENAVLQLESGAIINAVHAGSLVTKLLQLASGAAYDQDHLAQVHNSDRAELVMQLVEEREHCVIAFNWTHQRDELIKMAGKFNFSYGLIDGTVSQKRREEVVRAFQAGELRLILAHPQSAGHGLTLTRGTTTIWTSPTYNAELFLQFNARIHRAGQTKRTETLLIAAQDTLEAEVYAKLANKLTKVADLLQVLKHNARKAA